MQFNRSIAFVVSLLTAGICFAQPATKPATAPSLGEQVAELKAARPPVTPAELKTWPSLKDQRNAAKVVWSLADRMRQPTPEGDGWHRPLKKKTINLYRSPLAGSDVAEIREALETQQDALKLLDRIPELDGFDWGKAPTSPYVAEHEEFPSGAQQGTCRHQLYLDGLLAVHERDVPRVWRRVEILRRLGEGMSTHPGEDSTGAQWSYLHELSARLAAVAAAAGVTAPEQRDTLEQLKAYWLDEEPVLRAAVSHYQRERIAVIDAHSLVSTGSLTAKQLQRSDRDVGRLQGARIGVPMWPTVVAYHTGLIDTLRGAKSMSRDDSLRRTIDFHHRFSESGFIPMHVALQLAPWQDGRLASLRELRALQKLAAAAIGVQLYRVDNSGTLPALLEDLVPKYCPPFRSIRLMKRASRSATVELMRVRLSGRPERTERTRTANHLRPTCPMAITASRWTTSFDSKQRRIE